MKRWILKILDRYFGGILVGCLGIVSNLFRTRGEAHCIILVKLVGLGDTALMAPIVSLIRRSIPGVKIVMIVTPVTDKLFLENRDVDDLVVADLLGGDFSIFGFVDLIRRCRRMKPLLFIDFEHYFNLTATLGLLSGSRERIGLASKGQARGKLFTQRVIYEENINILLLYYQMYLAACNVFHVKPFEMTDLLEYRLASRDAPAEVLCLDGKNERLRVGLHPGCGSSASYRRWAPESFQELVQRLVSLGRYRVIITAGPGESELAERIGSGFGDDVVISRATSVRELVELIRTFDVYVSNDTGPMHLGPWVGTKTIGLFGPNTPEVYGSLHQGSKAIYHQLPCSPCIRVGAGIVPVKCSHETNAMCMKLISVDEILGAIEEAVGNEDKAKSPGRYETQRDGR